MPYTSCASSSTTPRSSSSSSSASRMRDKRMERALPKASAKSISRHMGLCLSTLRYCCCGCVVVLLVVCLCLPLLNLTIPINRPSGISRMPARHSINWQMVNNLNLKCKPPNDHILENYTFNNMDRMLEPNANCVIKMAKWKDGKSSMRVMSQLQWLKMMSLMAMIDMVFMSNSVSYVLFGGALYGSYMSHDLLPWDDDIDIMIRHSDRHRMETALLALGPEYNLVNHTSKRHMKFFFSNTPKTWRYEWAWPFIDISFFDENSTHIWEIHHETDEGRIYPRDMVFPLHRRPLGYLWLASPRDTRAFLMKSIRGPDKRFLCGNQGWQHKAEDQFRTKYVQCQHLLNDYAAVNRSRASGGVMETLIYGKEILHSCFIQEPERAVTNGPFTFDVINGV
ncbi:PREDICTED: uncharacterized protein LOC106811973 [Priapulus caudatus]|uniref:Uncharacterized protein LOC106811973 n=1 Tax=Priapulus caudatus TaxID=37621 RepID=A0ABM1EG80_PRICU|nr:PREDICTED: uncharacterized protein LOC106811973 [Priapulus caudatus]